MTITTAFIVGMAVGACVATVSYSLVGIIRCIREIKRMELEETIREVINEDERDN